MKFVLFCDILRAPGDPTKPFVGARIDNTDEALSVEVLPSKDQGISERASSLS